MSRKALDRLNLRLHINEDHDYEGNTDPWCNEREWLKKPIELRSSIEKKAIHKYLLSFMHLRLLCHHLGMTHEHGISVLASSAQLFEYEFQRMSVWNSGDPAKHPWLVLEGSVVVQVPFQKHISFSIEKLLRPGELFGEIGILNDTKKRTASILTGDNNTLLLRLDRNIFLSELGPFFQKIYLERYLFLRSMKTFQCWSNIQLKLFAQLISERTVHYGDPIASEGNNIQNNYFLQILRRGHVRVEKGTSFSWNNLGTKDFIIKRLPLKVYPHLTYRHLFMNSLSLSLSLSSFFSSLYTQQHVFEKRYF